MGEPGETLREMNGRGRGKQPRKRSNMESYQNQAPSRAGTHCTHFTDQETENQKNSVTCPRLVASKSGFLGPQVSAQDYARTHASDGRWGGVLPGKASLWKPHSSAAHCPPTPVPGSARPPRGSGPTALRSSLAAAAEELQVMKQEGRAPQGPPSHAVIAAHTGPATRPPPGRPGPSAA